MKDNIIEYITYNFYFSCFLFYILFGIVISSIYTIHLIEEFINDTKKKEFDTLDKIFSFIFFILGIIIFPYIIYRDIKCTIISYKEFENNNKE